MAIAKPIWPGRAAPADPVVAVEAGWTVRYLNDFTEAHDFEAGGHGDSETFGGVDWTAHINETSGSGPTAFETGEDGLVIAPTYRSKWDSTPANPECPALWALIQDMIPGWDLTTDVCVQIRLTVTNFGSNFESAGVVIWEPSKSRSSRVSVDYRSQNLAVARREATATVSDEVAASPLPTLLELVIHQGLAVSARYGTWDGEWPSPADEASMTRPADWSWHADTTATVPGGTSGRPFTAAGARIAIYCGDDAISGSAIEMACQGVRVLELVG